MRVLDTAQESPGGIGNAATARRLRGHRPRQRRGSLRVRGISLRSPAGLACNAISFLVAAVIIDTTLSYDVYWWWHADSPWGYRAFIAVTAIAALTVLVLVHELGHGVVAMLGGSDVELTVSPTFGFARSNNEFRLAAIVAGPLANVALGITLEVLVRSGALSFLPLLAIRMALWCGALSLALGISNLLPVAPLDGYRVLTRLSGLLPTPALRAASCLLTGIVGAAGAVWLVLFFRPEGDLSAAAVWVIGCALAVCLACADTVASSVALARAAKGSRRTEPTVG